MPIRIQKALLLPLLVMSVGLQSQIAHAQAQCTPTSATTGTTTGSFPITLEDPLLTARVNLACNIQLSLPDCQANSPIPVGFTYGPLPSTQGTVSIFLSNSSSCENSQTSTGNTFLGPFFNLPNGMGVIPLLSGGMNTGEYITGNGFTVDEIVKFAGVISANSAVMGNVTLPSTCPTNLNQVPVYLCVAILNGGATINGTFGAQTSFIQFTIQTAPPPPPQSITVSPLNNGLNVSWTEPASAQFPINFQVVATNANDSTDVHRSSLLSGITTATNSVKITGLQNNVPYSVVVKTFDNSGINADFSDANEGDSPPTIGTPVAALDFLQIYADDGGQGRGCASGGASALALLGLGVLLFRRRRAALLAALIAATWSLSARADDRGVPEDIETAPSPITRIQSSRHFTAQVFLGTFKPNIDSAAGLYGATPYKDIFGTRRPLLLRAELDFDIYQKFGRLALGLAGGFWQAIGKARLKADPTMKAADTELLNLYPISLLLVYRADFIYERAHIPLVPFVKAGYGFVLFSDQTDGQVQTVTQPGGAKTWSSQGWGGGFEYAVGLQLVLDWIDPRSAQMMDSDFGINSTSVYFEYGQSFWKGFLGGGPPLGGYWIGGGLLMAF